MIITTQQAKSIFLREMNNLVNDDVWLAFRFFILSEKDAEEIENKDDFILWLRKIHSLLIQLNEVWIEKVLNELFSRNLIIYKLELIYNFVIFLKSNNPSFVYPKSKEITNPKYSIWDFCYMKNIFSYQHLQLVIDEDLKVKGWKSKWIVLIPNVLTFKTDSFIWWNKEMHSLTELFPFKLQDIYKNWLLTFEFEKIIY